MYKLICLKCGNVKIVEKKDDYSKIVNNLKILPFCEKCNGKTMKKPLSILDKVFNFIK
ncbi:hypothetical protein ACIB15232_a0084 (plasmid) [Aliarcobacter cibarius]|jgi:hypothetical protein|uniref:hypothetical protein n=1 Tax=Aliarcobacter cibarius TaxID=255507 RepID=UPI0012A2A792|nr:hypothetical protein [Aliarcobacter cibarius]QEZ90259.1 hypothetical protein ACIB15232_a0084 [Aliarcobacter cibarius]